MVVALSVCLSVGSDRSVCLTMMRIIRSGFVISSYDQLVSLVNDKGDEGGQRFLRVRPGVAGHFAKGGRPRR